MTSRPEIDMAKISPLPSDNMVTINATVEHGPLMSHMAKTPESERSEELSTILQKGLRKRIEETSGDFLAGRTFVFTGKFAKFNQEQYRTLVQELAGTVKSPPSDKVDIAVMGKNFSSEQKEYNIENDNIIEMGEIEFSEFLYHSTGNTTWMLADHYLDDIKTFYDKDPDHDSETESEPEDTPLKESPQKTLKMFKEGLSPKDIASERTFDGGPYQLTTIYSHLAHAIDADLLEVDDVLDTDRIKQIKGAFKKFTHNDGPVKEGIDPKIVRDVKEKLIEDLEYGEVECVYGTDVFDN